MDTDHHSDRYAGDRHHHRDAVDHYSNHHQYTYADQYAYLHFDCHSNGDLLPASHEYVYTNLYSVTNVDPFQHQLADDHVYAFIYPSTHVHPNSIHYSIPITNDTLSLK